MLPMPNASDLFTQQMRSRLGFGPSQGANSPMGPYGGGSSTGAFDRPAGPSNTHTPITPLGGMGAGFGMPGSTMTPAHPLLPPSPAAPPMPGLLGLPGSSTGNMGGETNTHTPPMPLVPQHPGVFAGGMNPWLQVQQQPFDPFGGMGNPTPYGTRRPLINPYTGA